MSRYLTGFGCLLVASVAVPPSTGGATFAQDAAPDQNRPAEDDPDDSDLAERLIRQATGEDEPGLMGEIMELMNDTARRLDQEFDPGDATRGIQDQIVKKLDDAIAAAQQRKRRSSSQRQQSDDKRQSPPKPADGHDQSDDASTEGDQANQKSVGTQSGAKQPAATGRFRDFRRGWGHLPQRDREEILQGIDEDVLEKYRPLIERYYRSLAEEGEE